MAVSTKHISSVRDSATSGLKEDASRGPVNFDTIERVSNKSESVAKSTTRGLERTLGGISKMEAMGLKEGIRLIRNGNEEQIEQFARITVIPEHQAMLMQRAEKMKALTLYAMLATNPALQDRFYGDVGKMLTDAIDKGLLPKEATIVLAKAPPDAVVAAEAKAHIVKRVDTPIPAFVVLVDLKTNPNKQLRQDAQETVVRAGISDYLEKKILETERTREMRAFVPRFTTIENTKELIASPETEEWIQLEMIYANASLSPSVIAKLHALNRPEITKALERRKLSMPIGIGNALKTLALRKPSKD